MTTILTGHVSPETAYVVPDYPYGYRLRCKIRYWLEYRAGHGYRLVSQTTNPKRPGEVWNKPKASTYARFAACMYLDDDNHVQWTALDQYANAQEANDWMVNYGSGVPEQGRVLLRKWVAAKQAYADARRPNDDLCVGLVEARKAFITG